MTVNEKLAEMKVAAELEVTKFAELMEANLIELKQAEDKGFDEGVKQNTTPGDKLYTEADLQAELKPLKEKIAALQVKVDGFAQALVDAKSAGASEMKATIVAKMEAVEVDNDALIAELKA